MASRKVWKKIGEKCEFVSNQRSAIFAKKCKKSEILAQKCEITDFGQRVQNYAILLK